MQTFKLTDVRLMGEPGEYGQAFWVAAEGVDMPLKFNKKVDNIPLGAEIGAEQAVEKKSAKGIPYLQLTGVQIFDNSPLGGELADKVPPKSPSAALKEPRGAAATRSDRSEQKYLKDTTDLIDRWMARLLPYFDAQNLLDDLDRPNENFRRLVETAKALAEEAQTMIDHARYPESEVLPDRTESKDIKQKLQTGWTDDE